MRLPRIFALLIPVAFAALFVRLGVWQLSRLHQKRAFNAILSERLAANPLPVMSLPADTALGHYRRVSASGTMLYDRGLVYAGRSHEGAPGVDVLTPMRIAGHDTVVMINRGWAFSPDAATLDVSKWNEKDSATVSGFAETFSGTERKSSATSATGETRATPRVHALDRAAVQALVGFPVAPYILVQTSDSGTHADSVPVRLAMPTLDEGPHESYAIQWFSFALVSLFGGVALYRRSR